MGDREQREAAERAAQANFEAGSGADANGNGVVCDEAPTGPTALDGANAETPVITTDDVPTLAPTASP